MLRLTTYVAVLLLATLNGCVLINTSGKSNYAEYANAKAEFSKTERVRAAAETATIMQVVSYITKAFGTVADSKPTPIYTETTETSQPVELVQDTESAKEDSQDPVYDSTKKVVTKTFYDSSGPLVALLIAQQRNEAIKFLIPVIRDIYRQQQLDLKAPPTAADVALAFVKQIPFMATVAGMYGLGAKGLEAAGDSISASVYSGGAFSNKGVSGSSYTQPTTTTTTTTTVPEE